MGKVAYLDTHVVVWLAEGRLEKITKAALDAVNQFDLRISPFVTFELSLLFERQRILRPAAIIVRQLRSQLGVKVCDFGLPEIADTACHETWTREPMDRMIVAHARANDYSSLISADETIRKNYAKTIW